MNTNAAQRLSELLDDEKAKTCGDDSRITYAVTHQARFSDILRLSKTYVPARSARVLDVGRSELTAYLAQYYKSIYSLGLDPGLDDGGHRETSSMDAVPHIVFDLLHADRVATWPEREQFDLIVFSEVIEHLAIAPQYVFAALGALLKDRGILICTTPNAADILKRLHLLSGKNPYERLRLYAMNPGHIREYTGQELRQIPETVGLQCIRHDYYNWYQPTRNPLKSLIREAVRSYPSFRQFQACILRKGM